MSTRESYASLAFEESIQQEKKKGRKFKGPVDNTEPDLYVPQKRNLMKALNRAYKKRFASPAYKRLIKDLSPEEREIVDRELDYCRYPKDWPVKA